MLTLITQKRDQKTNKATLRKEGVLPAVFYGKKTESTPVSISARDFKKVYKEAGESTVISIKDGSSTHEALIHDVQIHPVTDEPVHVDFYILEKGQKVNVTVPFEFVGESPAVKNLSGVLVKVMHELEIEAEAANLPHEIEIDISSLIDFESRITIKDVKLPSGVTTAVDSEEVVILAAEAKEEVIEEVEETPDLDSIEVEQKGKDEDTEDTSQSVGGASEPSGDEARKGESK